MVDSVPAVGLQTVVDTVTAGQLVQAMTTVMPQITKPLALDRGHL